jgi:nucleotide-binding universal stress UspA family protein
MFGKILVPVDLTAKNRSALAAAGELAGRSAGEICLLHVVETIEDVPYEELSDFYARLEARAHTAMEPLAAGLRDDGLAVSRRVAYGKRAPEIVRFADEWGAELILLSSHRIDPDAPQVPWATISYRVALLARCPVLLVK